MLNNKFISQIANFPFVNLHSTHSRHILPAPTPHLNIIPDMNLPWDNKLFLTRLTLRKTPRGMLRNQALLIINRAPSLTSPAPTPKRQVAQAGTAKSRRLCSEPVVAIIGAFLDL